MAAPLWTAIDLVVLTILVGYVIACLRERARASTLSLGIVSVFLWAVMFVVDFLSFYKVP